MPHVRFLLSTTVASGLLLGLSGGVSAQSGLPECGPGGGVPCLLDGERVNMLQARRLPACEAGEAAEYPCLSDEGDVLASAEQASEASGAEPTAEAQADTGAAESETAEAPPAVPPAQEQPVEQAAETAAPAATDPPAERPAETAETDAPAAAPVASAETETPVDSAADSAADGDATGKTLREKLESRAAAREATEEPADTGQAAETGDGADTASADTAVPAAEGADTPGQKLRDRLAEASEAAAAAAAASADTEADTADVVVEESTVAEGETRRASEEFDRTVSSGTDAATAAPTGQKDEGLSTFEKALLVGLGAIAVGELLDNGDRIVSNTGDRVVVQRGDEFRVLKDDDTLLRQPGSEVRTERFSDGSTRETLIQPDGRKIVTIRAADGRVLRRVRVLEDGTQVLLFDDTETYEPVDVATLPPPATETISLRDSASDDALRAAIEAELARDFGRNFSLAQIREIRAVRELVPTIEVEAITFALGSAAIRPELAGELADLGIALRDLIDARPGEVFLVEGHTDATGSAALNLALSDRRAETVALALTEFFDVPPENLVVQGYGESALKIQTEAAEEANRRVVVRRITPLLGDRRIAKDF